MFDGRVAERQFVAFRPHCDVLRRHAAGGGRGTLECRLPVGRAHHDLRAEALLQLRRALVVVAVRVADDHVLDVARIETELRQASDDLRLGGPGEVRVDDDDARRSSGAPRRNAGRVPSQYKLSKTLKGGAYVLGRSGAAPPRPRRAGRRARRCPRPRPPARRLGPRCCPARCTAPASVGSRAAPGAPPPRPPAGRHRLMKVFRKSIPVAARAAAMCASTPLCGACASTAALTRSAENDPAA